MPGILARKTIQVGGQVLTNGVRPQMPIHGAHLEAGASPITVAGTNPQIPQVGISLQRLRTGGNLGTPEAPTPRHSGSLAGEGGNNGHGLLKLRAGVFPLQVLRVIQDKTKSDFFLLKCVSLLLLISIGFQSYF